LDIILISGKGNKTVNLTIKIGFLILMFVIVAVILVLFIYNIKIFATSEIDQDRLAQLKGENKIVNKEIERIENEIDELAILIDSLELYDKKLRTHASLMPIDEDLRDMGVGGYKQDYAASDLSSNLSENLVELSQTLDNVLARARLQKESFDIILTHLEQKKYLQAHTPSIIPVQGWLIRGFGRHKDPFTGIVKMHEGLDIAAPIGTPIVASADGTVKFTGNRGDFGLTLEINHGYGFMTRYAHCQRLKVSSGMKVERGDTIAYVGNTGKSTGPHLHYEVLVSQIPVNPINYIITTSIIAD
jgi:murein DD-endopeptidase MepM/ murein hydrolase activator NlpD